MTGQGRKRILVIGILAVVVAIFVARFCGVYSVQPLGGAPEGVTAIVWRDEGEPFFNSPDALCLERMGGVSLLCRAAAISRAPTDRIIVRLPYQQWAYEASTGGRTFDR